MNTPASPSLDAVPQEILEHIAFFAATETFLGPPSTVVSLVSTNRTINGCLSIASNHLLYARIFAYKFDVVPVTRRLGSECTTPAALSNELQQRCLYLKRMRKRLDSIASPSPIVRHTETLRSVLWVAYLMMLENDGKNERQLREYAKIEDWLAEFWFDDHGASLAKLSIKWDRWPPNNEQTSLAMWLFWFLLKPDEYEDNEASWNVVNILKIFALAAHKYYLTSPSWVDFVPASRPDQANSITHYSGTQRLTPAPLAAPAILAFLTLVNKMLDSPAGVVYSADLTSLNSHPPPTASHEWESEWGRCLSLGQTDYDKFLTESFRPGSIEGVWEGRFTYTEFTAYAALLAGAPPPVLQRSMVVRHRQTWRLREYHLLAPDPSRSDSGIEMDSDNIDPLSAGDPLRSYFPPGTRISEDLYGIEVREPRSKETLHYKRASIPNLSLSNDERCKPCIQDVIITGEGHSAWGQFNLVGRVRPCDGFISLCKEYVDGDRGKWIYRGYLVGNVDGHLTGRWRDTLSPAEVQGYEGCFTMSRRR